MPSTIFGVGPGDWRATPNFRVNRGADGLWTGSAEFKMLRGTWEAGAKASFARGTPLTAVFPELDDDWSFLLIEEAELGHERGGYVTVTTTLSGFNAADYDSDREVTYILNGVTEERPITEHPLYITTVRDVSSEKMDQQKPVLVGAYNGQWAEDSETPRVVENGKVKELTAVKLAGNLLTPRTELIDVPAVIAWWIKIIDQGWRSYDAPTLEWTKETANAGGLSGDDVEQLGFIDEPEGNQPTPFSGNFNWRLVSINETIASGVSATSKTWRMSQPGGWDRDIYDYPPSTIDSIGGVFDDIT